MEADRRKGFGNKFLVSLRDTDAFPSCLSCLADDCKTHVDGSAAPVRDKEVSHDHLQPKALETIERRSLAVERPTISSKPPTQKRWSRC